MAVIVQKYGGTSVATIEARAALLNQVKAAKNQGNKVVLVVSAMGRAGDPYATDTLIGLLESISPEIAPRKKDLIMSCGEIISSAVISHLLESEGIGAEPLTGSQAGILTTDTFGNSDICHIEPTRIKKMIADDIVPVIAGFQGITDAGEITTLGRGGSDTAAVTLGGFLNADRVDIFTDVPGIAKVDPRIVPEAAFISDISYNDMFRLAEQGAKVIHPRAVQAAREFSIPVRVRSTFSDEEGTLISGLHSAGLGDIIGLALRKVDLVTGSIFILFNADSKEKIYRKVLEFCEKEEIDLNKTVWESSCVEMSVNLSSLNETTRLLYRILHQSEV